jgi:hypothetical protein
LPAHVVVATYLWASAVLYAGFAVWCTIAAERTARAAGYVELTPGGRSEYLVVYGGLQLGLAACFAWLAATGAHRTGLLFALAITAPIVVYRAASVVRHSPVGATTLWLGALELALLAGALGLWAFARPPA